jgi:hypothetical protein
MRFQRRSGDLELGLGDYNIIFRFRSASENEIQRKRKAPHYRLS